MPLSVTGRPPAATAIEVIHAALDAGITWIDTADAYCLDMRDFGHNERLIARALAQRGVPIGADRPNGVAVATKGGLERPDGDWTSNGHPQHLQRACEASLMALGVERIDLYQLHAPDDDVPFAESVGALARLKEQGKIARIGLSNVTVEQLDEAAAITPIHSVQNRCSYYDTTVWEDGTLAWCEARGVAMIAYSPLNGMASAQPRAPLDGHRLLAADPRLNAVAARHGESPYAVALAWLLQASPVLFPIPGARTAAHVRDAARALSLVLSPDDLALLQTPA